MLATFSDPNYSDNDPTMRASITDQMNEVLSNFCHPISAYLIFFLPAANLRLAACRDHGARSIDWTRWDAGWRMRGRIASVYSNVGLRGWHEIWKKSGGMYLYVVHSVFTNTIVLIPWNALGFRSCFTLVDILSESHCAFSCTFEGSEK